jgi:predicted RNase H-like HicB family nuclease
MINRYLIEILYSDEDGGFIAIVPELPGCSAFGETDEDALVEVRTAIDLWLETARAEGYPVPEPAGRALARS